ncbi:hypothetical protein MPER_15458, partial [Moniliophthora perniciosa FA553]
RYGHIPETSSRSSLVKRFASEWNQLSTEPEEGVNYFCTELPLRPASFVGLIVWLIFLFSTLGISASDFFTPNLATIAQLLGLDENVAGVTFL